MNFFDENGNPIQLDAPFVGFSNPNEDPLLSGLGITNFISSSNFTSNSGLLESHRGMTNVSPFAAMFFSNRTQNEIESIYFPGREKHIVNDVKVITDVDINPNRVEHIKKRKVFFDKNANKTFEPTIDVFAFNIELYFSKDGIKLKETFEVTEPDPFGIIFFIEDNTDDISFQTCRVLIGDHVKDNLKNDAQLYNNKNVYDFINEYVTIDEDILRELIQTGTIENVALKSVEFLFTANDYLNPLGLDRLLITGLGKICGAIGDFINKGKLADYRWNPNAEKKDETGIVYESHTFTPFFFPFIEDTLDQIPDDKINEYARKGFEGLKKGFLAYDEKIRNYIEATDFGRIASVPVIIGGIPFPALGDLEIDLIPDSAEAFVFSKYKQVSDKILAIFKELESFDLTDIVKKGIRIANAFLCGIWNGLLDAVSGIFKMLEMVFNGMAVMRDYTRNISTQFPLLLEYVDNAIVAIANIDYKAIYKHLQTKFESITNVPLETVAYFSGAFVGFIVSLVIEIVIGILFTGGTLTVAAVIEKLTTLFSSIFRGIASAGRAVFNFAKKLVINTFKSFTKLLDDLLAFLRKSTKEFKAMIDDIFKVGKKTAKFGKVTRALMRKEMPDDFLKALKKMGRKENDILDYFVGYHNDNNFIFLNEIDDIITKNPNLTKTDAFSLWSYTTKFYYKELNNWLRNGINVARTKEISKLITNALGKMSTYNGKAFRALEFSDEALLNTFLKNHKKGNIVDYNDFVSSGSNTKAAFFDKLENNVFLELEVKNAPIISNFSDGIKLRGYAKEELLLLRGRKFEIEYVKPIKRGYEIKLIEK
ncbi:hypothetical protein GCM10011344_05420 [Dokdonia pacifica]|uniref:NAD(+)--protein-arginine ADP-ribosyltransferase n=1 Tax=Dokdonia pacifica TaxID=1627892 RepID=A0A238ZP42_9FLAO|nr:hypothetical protein [Dokdonia pacifica]GGG07792.1 hypothetical protein GCM10011344_05420 [Dokdonia pacifica]SNR85216.1 hypothetical protein SAMN06265376_103409 [Dokdonia pacifica]